MNTTKPEWEVEFDEQFHVLDTPDGSEYFKGGFLPWPRKIKSFIASKISGTVKVEELKERIKALPELTDSEGHSAGGFIERDSVLALLDEKK